MDNVLNARNFLLRKKANEIADRVGINLAKEFNLLSTYNSINMLELISIANYICATLSINIMYSALDSIKKSFPHQDLKAEYDNVERNLKQSIEIINKAKKAVFNGRD